MLNLVKKDLKLLKKMNIFVLFYVLFICAMGVFASNNILANIIYILGMITLIFASIIYTNGYDDKYKSEIVLNSFPIDRRNIVRGKYVSLIIYILIVCSGILIFTHIVELVAAETSGRSANIWNAILVMNISLIFYSIYYPFYFKVGESIRSFNAILYVLIFVFPAITGKLMKRLENTGQLEKILNIDINKISIYSLIFSLIIFYISMQISKGIYLKREF
jgi:ABC-type transport system involved in multi-copper enzyme maturation permease subunit